jgi:hypothetical protein
MYFKYEVIKNNLSVNIISQSVKKLERITQK